MAYRAVSGIKRDTRIEIKLSPQEKMRIEEFVASHPEYNDMSDFGRSCFELVMRPELEEKKVMNILIKAIQTDDNFKKELKAAIKSFISE